MARTAPYLVFYALGELNTLCVCLMAKHEKHYIYHEKYFKFYFAKIFNKTSTTIETDIKDIENIIETITNDFIR